MVASEEPNRIDRVAGHQTDLIRYQVPGQFDREKNHPYRHGEKQTDAHFIKGEQNCPGKMVGKLQISRNKRVDQKGKHQSKSRPDLLGNHLARKKRYPEKKSARP